jgi:tRNA A-37 threonylcarbamoyl transferase component Bud32
VRQDALKIFGSVWSRLADEAGLETEGWSVHRLSAREDARVSRDLFRLSRGGHDIVLKQQIRPRDPEGFMAAMAAHLDVNAHFPDDPMAAVPTLLAVDTETQSCLMSFAEGRTLSDCLERANPGDQGTHLERAGLWLDRFHRARLGTARIFQPKFTYRYLDTILAEEAAGQRPIAEAQRFRKAASRFKDMRPRFEGQETVAAKLHGDLHMRNLLLGGPVWGLDFHEAGASPVGHDIARLLVDVATLRADHSAVVPREVLPLSLLSAFFRGYTLVQETDPSVQMLLRHRVLAEWWGLPAEQRGRSPAQSRRFDRLMSLVSRVFEV